ncbi:asparagine synthase (glutamine-hydrolyzing) [Synechococcus sp. NB0720_010]|uniref:asparagine synthase (glutamine-hydrolyzing) n=1 Tax=Synechococcus sp. NB0720_010 TaxID=2907159 RepID=UPI001FFA47F5|nr:asparagine synthase (glutamine-hydrolyzing) [Synechococcus sp. NB0720_010]UPH89133.1 asparagine synthase (glutamine-hydrolyzing) [Synechococcus sp. NB0720_010]
MCGIIGAFSSTSSISHASFARALTKLERRGPDNSSYQAFMSSHLLLGHTRLSIIDLSSHANQPFLKRDNAIVFNGEIYNYKELRHRMSSHQDFTTSSDTEVLLSAYSVYGMDMFSYLDGMYAFAIYDPNQRRLTLARDIAGEKPLYYLHTDSCFYFASELSALTSLCGAQSLRLDPEAFTSILMYGYSMPGESIYQEIKELEPGRSLVLDLETNDTDIRTYWEPVISSSSKPFSDPNCDIVTSLDSTLKSSVHSRLESDVEVGLLLSGGIDSGLVAAYASQARPDIRSFTVSFQEKTLDESEHASAIAQHLGINHTVIQASPPTAEHLISILDYYHEPLADSSLIPTTLVSQTISRELKVALSGDGGDELFGGYTHYSWLRRINHISSQHRRSSKLISACSRVIPGHVRGRRFLASLGQSPSTVYSVVNQYFEPHEIFRLLTPDFLSEIQISPNASLAKKSKPFEQYSHYGVMTAAMLADFQTYLPCDILAKTDRASMYNSLELRSPFLAKDVIASAYTSRALSLLPSASTSKPILRKIATKYLPSSVTGAPKRGFGAPIDQWLKHGLNSIVKEYLSSLDPSVFSKPYIETLLLNAEKFPRLYGKVFLLLSIARFLEREQVSYG